MDNINKRLEHSLKIVLKEKRVGIERVDASRTLYERTFCRTCNDEERKKIVDSFFTVLDNREKSKYGSVDYQRFYYYQAKNGRLAAVAKNKAEALIRRGKIKDHVALEEIQQGTYVKHRRIIESLEKTRSLTIEAKRVLENHFDIQLPCKMIIDTDFYKAYEPSYHGSFVTDGDAATESSCMSGRPSEAVEFYGGIKGCSVARFETSDGKQVGRCIVYEQDGVRHFVRVYGLGLYQRTMLNLIKDEMKENDLFGRNAKIKNLFLETNWDYDTPNMYLDGYYGLTIKDEKFYVASSPDYDLDSTSRGTIGETLELNDDPYYCDRCGRRAYEDERIWIDGYVYCCSDCAYNAGYRYCECCGEWFYCEDGIKTNDDNYYCCESCAERNNYYKCGTCGEYHYQDDFYSSEDGCVEMCKDCFESSDYTLDENGYIVEKQQEMNELLENEETNE